MKKKILYLFSDTGGGHRSAATALTKAVKELKGDEVAQEMVDVFAQCSGFLNVFAKLYAPVIKYVPKFWGRLFYFLDDMNKLRRLERMARPFIRKELEELLQAKLPDLIVSVHPMVNHIAFQAIKDSGHRVPMVTVITDPVTFHRVWVEHRVDMLIVATEEAKARAIQYGMTEDKIKVLGMPIDPKFLLGEKEKEKARRIDHLKPRLFTILLMGGGEGAGGMYKIIKAIDNAKLTVQLIVIAGRNEKLKLRLDKEAKKFHFPIKIYGFTDKVHEIMAESDLLITKAGPGTIAEAMAMNLPIIITSWLPGQEEGNVEFVLRESVGSVTRDPEEVVKIIKDLQTGDHYDKMMKNIKRVRRPHAAFDIAKLILHYLR